MLTRNSNLAPQDQYYNDALLKVPTVSESMYDNLAAQRATPTAFVNDVASELSKAPRGQSIQSGIDAVNLENETPGMGWPQKVANYVAGVVGYASNPITWVGAGAGGLVARGVTGIAEKVAPEAMALLSRSPVKLSTFAGMTGASVPQAVVDNYHQDTNHIAWGGVAKDSMVMGGMGLAIDAIPYAYGLVRGKINRGLGNEPSDTVDTKALDAARDKGLITPDEHQWYSDYLQNQKNPNDTKTTEKLQNQASNIINKNGQLANTVTNSTEFKILTPEDMQNLQGAISDQIVSDLPEEHKTTLSDFIIHNRIQDITSDPQKLDGLRGYVDFVNKKLENKSSKLADADAILDKHLLRGATDNMPFSQKDIFKQMKKMGFEASHVNNMQLTIPDNLFARLKSLDKIKQLKVKLQVAARKGHPENLQTVRRINELQDKLPKLLTPKEELQQLRDKLLSDKGLPKNFQLSKDYQRLSELSTAWHNAGTLSDRVNLEHEYNRQEAFKNVADSLLKISDSSVGKIIEPKNVMDYLKQRVEGAMQRVEEIKYLEYEVNETQEVPTDADTILSAESERVKKSSADDMKKDFENSNDKFQEFKRSGNIFKNLISCVMGSLTNG